MQTSEDPLYRVSSLEGQLRHCQSKLTESIRSYDSKLAKQQLNCKELLEAVRTEHDAEMKQALQRIEDLVMAEKDKSVKADTQSLAENTPPPLKLKSPTRRKRRSKNKGESLTPNTSKPELNLVPASPATKHQASSDSALLRHDDRPKSASYGDLTTIVQDESTFKLPNTPQVSPANAKKKMGQKNSSERGTITSLVAESLSNPSSMLAIKKELKSDSFTPKIQRKFQQKSPAALMPVNTTVNGDVVTSFAKEGKT